jgi:glycosyltransferase involved in cell wall biosynthesis
MDNPLVSIITPCYNGERFVHRFFESILAQTYSNIELIFINDGSTDRTEQIVRSYKPKLVDRGFGFKYIYQENKGQAAAVNRGLKFCSGDYLTWPDSDDWLSHDSIEKRVRYLQNNPEYSIVVSRIQLMIERDGEVITGDIDAREIRNPHIFYDLLLERDVPFHDYMVRTVDFFKALPSKQIVVSLIGQNWQMLLPIAYNKLCGFIDGPLYFCLIREDSHCRQFKTYEELVQLIKDHEDTLIMVIRQMNLPEREEEAILHLIHYKYLKKTADLQLTKVNGQLDLLRQTVVLKSPACVNEIIGQSQISNL